MAKNYYISIIIFLLSFLSCDLNAQCLKNTYTAEIGVRETGWNKGVRIKQYLEAVHLKEGNPWCAAFVVWCHIQCGYDIVLSGYSPSLFPSKKIVKVAKQGDVFGIYFKSKGRIAHVGIIDKVLKNGYITVEGNTGSDNYGQNTREGDGVYKKNRMKSQIYKISRWDS